MSIQSSGNIISIFDCRPEVALHDDPLKSLLTEFSHLSDEVVDCIEETEVSLQASSQASLAVDLSLLTDDQLFEFIESRVNQLRDLQKRLHYFGSELAQYVE